MQRVGCDWPPSRNPTPILSKTLCSKTDAEYLAEWGRRFGIDAIEPAHFKIHPTMPVIKAILDAPDPLKAREWAMENEAGSKAIKNQFGVPMTTAPKPTTVKATTERRGDGVYRITVPMDVDLPEEVEVRYKE